MMTSELMLSPNLYTRPWMMDSICPTSEYQCGPLRSVAATTLETRTWAALQAWRPSFARRGPGKSRALHAQELSWIRDGALDCRRRQRRRARKIDLRLRAAHAAKKVA